MSMLGTGNGGSGGRGYSGGRGGDIACWNGLEAFVFKDNQIRQ